MRPIRCGDGCRCYYRQDEGNVYNCSSTNAKILPSEANFPNGTDWLDVSDNRLNLLCGHHPYLKKIQSFFLTNNNISEICDNTLNTLKHGKLEILEQSHNQLSGLPRLIQNVTSLRQIWLLDNPFKCDCDMLWMKNWMENFNNSGYPVVQKYHYLYCENMGNSPIHALNPVAMGCYPKVLTLWEKMGIGIAATVTTGIVIAIIAISRRWNEVKWLMYLHFDIPPGQDKKEKWEEKNVDAVLFYK